jgi:hypothetical protein
MENNPFVTVPSPNYAAPIVNLFGNQNQKPQQNQQQQQNPQNPQQPNWGQRLRAWLQQQQGQQPGGDQALAAYNNPNLTMRQRVGLDPLDITPGSVAGANTLTAGLY